MLVACIMSFLYMWVMAQDGNNWHCLMWCIIPRARRDELRRKFIDRLVNDDIASMEQLCMNVYTFQVLCNMLQIDGQLKEDGLVPIQK